MKMKTKSSGVIRYTLGALLAFGALNAFGGGYCFRMAYYSVNYYRLCFVDAACNSSYRYDYTITGLGFTFKYNTNK